MRVLGTILMALLVPGALASGLAAATFTVTKETDDNGPCDVVDCALREAIIASNENPGFDTILIPGGRYVLSIAGWDDPAGLTGTLRPKGSLDIIGDTELPVIIDADGIDQVFDIVGSVVRIHNVTITGGAFPGYGGGVSIYGANVTITNSTITGNQSLTRDGGGISVWAGDVALINSTVSNNYASRVGGGIDRTDATGVANVTLINSTVSGNYASQAGGIYSDGRGDLVLINSTVAANTSFLDVTGIFSRSTNGPIMTNTIVLDRCGFYYASDPRSNGGNIETPESYCFLQHPTDRQIPVSDLLLGPLTSNGGLTMTHALLPGSPAIDAGVPTDCPTIDQRGRPRPIDGNGDGAATCDAGAYEFNPRAVDIPAVNPVGLIVFAALITAIALVKIARRTPETVLVAGTRPSTRGHEAIGD
ncbi:MAG: hypothetical protein GY835_10285 [bacterium]|nr:hypothetical protein [bacterium]